MPASDLMTKAEIQTYLRISRGTLDKLMKTRSLPFIKLDKKVLFRRADVDRWLESKTVRAPKKC